MTKWLADFEVESHASISENGKKLIFQHPSNVYEVHVTNLKVGPGLEKQLLRVQIIFESDTIDVAYEKSKSHLMGFLDVLSLVSNCAFKIGKLLKIIDWNPHVTMRDCHQFVIVPDPAIPYPIISDALFESVATLMTNAIPPGIKRSLRWYALGIRALYSDEQFQYFWFALEHLAEYNKKITDVPDSCPHCHSALYCKTCDRTPTHRPYAKQAISQLIGERVKGESEKLFDVLNEFRNGLLHGKEIEEIEKKQKISLSRAVDLLGKTVWAALISSFKAPPPMRAPLLVETNTYAHKELVMKAILQVGNSVGDAANPKIENFDGTQVTVEFHEGNSPISSKKDLSPT